MRKKTLDILDTSLSESYSSKLGLKEDDRWRIFEEKFKLDPNYWSRHYSNLSNIEFKWQEFNYHEVVKSNDLKIRIKSKETGIYFFLIKPKNLIYDLPKFVVYVGIAGAHNSKRPLVERLQDYFRLEEIKKRKAVHRIIQQYYHHIYVVYTLLDVDYLELERIEKELIGFFFPICNKDDFPVDLGNLKKAFN